MKKSLLSILLIVVSATLNAQTYVQKTGDTMTGDLTLNNANFWTDGVYYNTRGTYTGALYGSGVHFAMQVATGGKLMFKPNNQVKGIWTGTGFNIGSSEDPLYTLDVKGTSRFSSEMIADKIRFTLGGAVQPLLSRNSNGGLDIDVNGIANASEALQIKEGAEVKFRVMGNGDATILGNLKTDGYLVQGWTYDNNWGGSSSKWGGWIGFNAYRDNNDAKDNYYGINQYTRKNVLEGRNGDFRFLSTSSNSTTSTALNEVVKISYNGNTYIHGNLESKKVRVTATPGSVPDYVFQPDYQLPALSEVETFVKKNSHLPDIPSAKEIEANGQDVGSLQLKMLEKIEQLLLYTIEQQKRIECLEKELKILKNK